MNLNDLGKNLFVENCKKICIKEVVDQVKKQLKEILIKQIMEIEGFETTILTSQTGNGGYRYWFCCPICKQRKAMLFKHSLSGAIGCRSCLNLKYKKSSQKGMIESNILDVIKDK